VDGAGGGEVLAEASVTKVKKRFSDALVCSFLVAVLSAVSAGVAATAASESSKPIGAIGAGDS
jgi:hypothetical protein